MHTLLYEHLDATFLDVPFRLCMRIMGLQGTNPTTTRQFGLFITKVAAYMCVTLFIDANKT